MDQSIQEMYYVILKKEALVQSSVAVFAEILLRSP